VLYNIEELLKDTNLRREIAEYGYVFARENFSVEIGIAKLTSVIKEAICENITHSTIV
jgi:glycosyltransferase involved in cell wall biosynthesis